MSLLKLHDVLPKLCIMPGSFEEFDSSAWDHGVELFQAWKKTLYNEDLYYEIVRKVVEHRMGGHPLEILAPQKGAFNVYYRVRFAEDQDALMRFPQPAYFRYAEEKLDAEVAAMRFVADNTTIPIPFVLHYGPREESPGGLGPFLTMEWVDNAGDVVDVLNTPGLSYEDPPVLDPDINEETLFTTYGQMAGVLLQLWRHDFTSIGSFGFAGSDNPEPEVIRRPLSVNSAQVANFVRVPHYELPSSTFTSSSAYYSALADMHLQQLSYQRNQAVESADDCRKKYIARQLFRKLAAEDRLAEAEFDRGPFKFWCDDFRPANVLADASDKIAAVIDWEFSHTAPAEFASSPPWWLLLKAPEDWEEGLADWAEKYSVRLITFLKALRSKEDELLEQGLLQATEKRLSERMRESWETGRFWTTYAARRTFAFDGIYWEYLDEMFFGNNHEANFMERLKLLPAEQVDAMEAFVARKLRERDEGGLADWYAPDAASRRPPDILKVGRV